MSSPYGKEILRASLLQFLLGKAFNAAISLIVLVALARWMAPDDYGVYIALLALQSSLLALSSLGIDATTERFMPELRTCHGDGKLLAFVTASLCARLGSLLLLALITWFAARPIAASVGLEGYLDTFRNWVLVMICTGILSFVVVSFEAMLKQCLSQRCMSLYVLTKFVLLVGANQYGHVDLADVVLIEMVATGIAAATGTWLLMRHFSASGLRGGWGLVLENRRRLGRFAFFNYMAQLAFQFFSAEVMKLLVTRILGVLQSARYGFANGLAETVQRYLPAVLLLRLIKPVFVSRYIKTGEFSKLNDMARIVLKLNLLVLAPVIAGAAAYGAEFLELLSGGKYSDVHWILVGVLVLLVPSSHQLVLSLLASTLEKNAMQLYAGLVSTIAFPVAFLLVPKLGPYGAIVASAISAAVYNGFATAYLRRAGFDYRPDIRGVGIFLLGGLGLYGVALLLRGALPGWAGVGVALVSGSAIYLGLVRGLSAFTVEEREAINSILPKRLFVL